MTPTRIAVIGGSGIYDIDGLKDAKWVQVATPGASRQTRS